MRKAARQRARRDLATGCRSIGIAAKLFEGLSLGSVLLLAAIGLAITFGVMGVINMAHGEMIMLGAYTDLSSCSSSSAPSCRRAGSTPISSSRCRSRFWSPALVGIALERSVIRFLYGRPLETLLATWGVSLILQQAVRTHLRLAQQGGRPTRAG